MAQQDTSSKRAKSCWQSLSACALHRQGNPGRKRKIDSQPGAGGEQLLGASMV